MSLSPRTLLLTLDSLLPEITRRRQHRILFRARSLLALCLVMIFNFGLTLLAYPFDPSNARFIFPVVVVSLSLACLWATMRSARHEWIACAYLGLMALCGSLHLMHFRSLFLPVLYGYPVLILAGFLLCGRRLGAGLACWTILLSMQAVFSLTRTGWNPPLHLTWRQLSQNYVGSTVIILSLTCWIIGSYYWLIENARRAYAEEHAWLETAETMQEFLQLAGRIARTVEVPIQSMMRSVESLARSPQPVASAIYQLDQQAQKVQRFHRSFALLIPTLFEDNRKRIDPREIADHVLALCRRTTIPLQIETQEAPEALYGSLSRIILLLVLILYEAMEDTDARDGLPGQLRLETGNRQLLVAFDDRFVCVPKNETQKANRLVQDLCRALHARVSLPEEDQSWRLEIPLQQAL